MTHENTNILDNTSQATTIVACATPPGNGGVGIIRISGSLTKHIANKMLGKTPKPRYATYANFLAKDGNILDQGIALWFPAPNSFTGEDVLELHGHGGMVIMESIVQQVLELGATLAKPGEFSERAFLNDKIDLTQAEAIADLINANSMQAVQYALRSLQGKFSTYIHDLVDKITQLRMQIEVSIDFADEEIDFIDKETLQQQLNKIITITTQTLNQAQQGLLVQEGTQIVITGEPNAGKSSLLNCLSGNDVAIVTQIAGTTRDVLHSNIRLGNLQIQLTDTAGLRISDDIIEQEGIKRARHEIQQAQHILLVVDYNKDGKKSPRQLIHEYLNVNYAIIDQNTALYTVLYNKIDLNATQHNQIKIEAKKFQQDAINGIYVSIKNHLGINLLLEHLQQVCGCIQTTENGFSARKRHVIALQNALISLTKTQELLANNNIMLELIAEELRQAQNHLGSITGEITSEDLLDKIFREFCLGK